MTSGEGSVSRGVWFIAGLLLGLWVAGLLGGPLGLIAQVVFGVVAGFAVYAAALWVGSAWPRGRGDRASSGSD